MWSVFLSVTVAGLAASLAGAATPVLKVNGADITDVQLKLARTAVERQLQGEKKDEAWLLRHALDQVIARELLVQAARDVGVAVAADEVKRSIDAKREELGGADGLSKALAKQGIDEQELARGEEERLLVQRFVATQLEPKVVITAADAKAYYDAHSDDFTHPEQLRLRMILVKVAQGADEKAAAAARARAEAAAARLGSGEEFGRLVAEVSEDPSKDKGGELGWVRRGLLLPELESAAFALNRGQTTGVIKTTYGYHLLRVDDRRGPGISPFDEIREALIHFLKNRELQELVNQVVRERRAKAVILSRDPALQEALTPPDGGRRQ